MTSTSTISVSLCEQQKWEQFYPKTEMITTKRRGRVIFPHLDFRIGGLEPNTLYSVHIHLERVDGIKYKFDQGEWKEAAKGDPILPVRYVEHSDGVRPGDYWMGGPVSFATLKITNDPNNADPKLILVQSMHKYQPVLTVKRIDDVRGEEFRLKITQFVVVTAYQNEEVIRLKVSHNKFASAFRGKRRNSSDNENSSAKRSPASSTTSTSESLTPPNDWNVGYQPTEVFPQTFPPFQPVQWNWNYPYYPQNFQFAPQFFPQTPAWPAYEQNENNY